MTDEEYVSFALSKDEKQVYEWLLRKHGHDPEKYLSSRRLECPPEHYADLGDIFAEVGAKELAEMEGEFDSPLLEITDKLMAKFAKKLQEAGLEDQAEKALIERGYDRLDNPEDIF